MDNSKFYDSPNDNSSIHSEKREKTKKNQDPLTIYNYIIESLNSEKEVDRIKTLILAEQQIHLFVKDKKKIADLFRIFETMLSDDMSNLIFKGQILMTSTTILILTNAKDDLTNIFLNFINNILIDLIKKTNDHEKIYLRQIACQCLEELEIEYPGLLFSLLGKKCLDFLCVKESFNDTKSITTTKTSKSKSEFPVFDKKLDRENSGLYHLITEESFFVFQYYLSLYTTTFKHLIAHYFNIHLSENNEPKELDFSQPSTPNKNSLSYTASNINYVSCFEKRSTDKVLHLNPATFSTYINQTHNFQENFPSDVRLSIPKEFRDIINKAFALIINNLPKTSELIQSKICKLLKFIITRIDINNYALLHHFRYFHLNSNSSILTLTTIKMVDHFESSLNENFILKLLLKLCLLINDLRLNKALRILALRWLLNIRFSNINFNFNKYIDIFSYYLRPFPFDNVIVRLEKLKNLFLFYDNSSNIDSNTIIQSISILDNYKHFPIHSNYVKTLFKAYFFIILRFPYKSFVKKLCKTIRGNLKEVPRILPNMINLLRNIKKLTLIKDVEKDIFHNMNINESCKENRDSKEQLNHTKIETIPSEEKIIANCGSLDFIHHEKDPNFIKRFSISQINTVSIKETKMTFDEIYKFLLVKLSNFLAKFKQSRRLNKYFDLFIEIAKENSIHPLNLIIGLRNLYNSVQEMRDWRIEKNILDVCKHLLFNHDLNTMKKNKIDELLNEICIKSFDYGIRDQAKVYYQLVTNVEKPILNTFLTPLNDIDFSHLKINYDLHDLENHLSKILVLEASKIERLKAKIEDGGIAIFDENIKRNKLFLSNCSKGIKYRDYIYKKAVDLDLTSHELYDVNMDTNNIIKNLITPNDILRLYIEDSMIDDSNDIDIDPQKIFLFEKDFVFSGESIVESTKSLNKQQFLDDYMLMISTYKFYIKLPFNLFLKSNPEEASKIASSYNILKLNNLKSNVQNDYLTKMFNLKEIYSISLCFGKRDHLDIMGPIIVPYLERKEDSSQEERNFPYFYKIYLIIYPKLPIPSDVETRAIFYDSTGFCFTGRLNSVKINFEDFFLPINVPLNYKNIYRTEGKTELREIIFKELWSKFKINKDNYLEFVNTYRLVDVDKDKMVNIVNKRLGPFLINEKFLSDEYVIKNPYHQDYIDTFSDSFIRNEKHEKINQKIKNYYCEKQMKFISNYYDFTIDEFLDKNISKSYLAKFNTLKLSKYFLAKVLIFVPEKYHILFKIKISDLSTVVEIRSDCRKIIEYLDEYFDSWLI